MRVRSPFLIIVAMSETTVLCKSSQRVQFESAYISMIFWRQGQILGVPRAHDSTTSPRSPTYKTVMVDCKCNLTYWLSQG